jgi:hypothetical protein
MTTTLRHTIRFTDRVSAMQESPTLAVLNRATALIAKGVDVVDFGPGEPDFATPHAVAEAGKSAIDRGFTKYTNASGTKALREALAARGPALIHVPVGELPDIWKLVQRPPSQGPKPN